MQRYLVTEVATDTAPPEPASTVIEGRDAVRAHLEGLLTEHGRIGRLGNAQMLEEADQALQQLDRWFGERPIKLCGHLTRYDVDLLAPGQHPRWRDLRDREERQRQDRWLTQQIKRYTPSVTPADPEYPAVREWLLAAHLVPLHTASQQAPMLAEALDLADELIAAGLLIEGYSRLGWALATAQLADQRREPISRVRDELRAEIAQRTGR